MSKNNATDTQLGELHGKLAQSMLKALDASNAAADLIAEYADEIPGPVLTYLSTQAAASPSLLTAIAKFLKDNEITCQVDESNEMGELEKRLASKKTRKAVGNVVPFEE